MSKHLIFTFSRWKCFGLEMRKCFNLIFPMWQRSDFFLSKWQVLCCLKLTNIFPVSQTFYFKDSRKKIKDKRFSFWWNETVWVSPKQYFSIFFLCNLLFCLIRNSFPSLPSFLTALDKCHLIIRRQMKKYSCPQVFGKSGSLRRFIASHSGGDGHQRHPALHSLSWWANGFVQGANCNTSAAMCCY